MVSEEQIASAMRVVWERMKLVIEPSAAVPVVVVCEEKIINIRNEEMWT